MNKVKEWLMPEDPKELVRKWQSTLRAEERALDRQVRGRAVHQAPCGSLSVHHAWAHAPQLLHAAAYLLLCHAALMDR